MVTVPLYVEDFVRLAETKGKTTTTTTNNRFWVPITDFKCFSFVLGINS